MKECKREYFINGVDNQKRADIMFQIKSINNKKIERLNQEQLSDIIDFLTDCQDTLKVVQNGIIELYKK